MCLSIAETNNVAAIKQIHKKIKIKIITRFKEFKEILTKGTQEDIFAELIFCLLTPQSKAKSCWDSVKRLVKKNLLLVGDKNQIVQELTGIRFKYKKAGYIIEARSLFLKSGKLSIKEKLFQLKYPLQMRDWLVQNIRGIGYKEASHFLRNIGLGDSLAILDRHILKNLKLLQIIENPPRSLTKKKYIEIEKKMRNFAKRINIPINHLDLVLWYKETGQIFK